MGWKKFPYWLKGGIVVCVVPFILLTLLLIVDLSMCYNIGDDESRSLACTIYGIPFAFGPALITGGDSIPYLSPLFYPSLILGYLIDIAIFFVIGSVIGWTYGKMKRR